MKSSTPTILLLIIATIMLFFSCKNSNNHLVLNADAKVFTLSKTDAASYPIKLTKDKYYSFTVAQKGIDVVVYLKNSNNEILLEKDSPNGSYGPEQLYFYCENQDDYQLQIVPLQEDGNPATGQYALSASEISTDTKISMSEKEYLEDFKLFKAIFENANAGLYRYHSKKEVDSIFKLNKDLIHKEITYLEFYNLIWNVIDYTGSCHNNLDFPDYLRTLLFTKDVFFPLPLKYIDGKLYANSALSTIPAGAEIISIDEIDAALFTKNISAYRSTDGNILSAKYNFIQTSWIPFYIYNAYGEKDAFNIRFKDASETKSVLVNSVSYHAYNENYTQRYSKPYEKRMLSEYDYKFHDSLATGVLTIKSFDVGEQGDETYNAYESFLDSVFISLKDKNKLIVDIRGNGGGSGDALMLLTSYLSERNVKENTKAYTLFDKIPFPNYYTGSVQQMEDFLSNYVTRFEDGNYYQNNNLNPSWEPNKNAFLKEFILLIDPYVASAASHFAAHIKSDKKALVIGEETGGTYYGHTGHIPVAYELPNSKLNLSFSIVNLEQDVAQLPDEKFGNGIIPDIKITQSYSDYLDHKDSQMNFAMEYLNKQP